MCLGEPTGMGACRHPLACSGMSQLLGHLFVLFGGFCLVVLNIVSLILAFKTLAANGSTINFFGLLDKVWLGDNQNEDR